MWHLPTIKDGATVDGSWGCNELEWRTYSFVPICIRALLDVLPNIPVWHPLGHHGEFIPYYGHPKERQCIWMLDGFPCYDLPPEPLPTAWWIRRTHKDIGWSKMAHLRDFLSAEATWGQNLDCNLPTTIFTFRNGPMSTPTLWIAQCVPG